MVNRKEIQNYFNNNIKKRGDIIIITNARGIFCYKSVHTLLKKNTHTHTIKPQISNNHFYQNPNSLTLFRKFLSINLTLFSSFLLQFTLFFASNHHSCIRVHNFEVFLLNRNQYI